MKRFTLDRGAGSARELLTANIGSDPYELIDLMRDAGARKAKAEGIAYQMEQERKVVLAEEATRIEREHDGKKVSETRLERLARASERYRQHLRGTAAAIEEKELAHSEYWAIRSELEWDQNAVWHSNALAKLER